MKPVRGIETVNQTSLSIFNGTFQLMKPVRGIETSHQLNYTSVDSRFPINETRSRD